MRLTERGTLLLTIAVSLISAMPAWATAQTPDVLLMNGRKYSILTNPLEPFLVFQPEKRPTSEITSTGLWRGYLATWTIDAGRLSLSKIEILDRKHTDDDSFETEYRDVTDVVFPGQQAVVADWFSGHIVIPTGKLVEYVHMGYASTYKKYLLLRIEHGAVAKECRLKRTQFEAFRDAQFAAFTQTSQYQAEVEEMRNDGKRTDDEIRSFLFRYYSGQYLTTIFGDDASTCSWSQAAKQ